MFNSLMLQNLTEIGLTELAERVHRMKQDGFRFVTITCTDLGDAFDLLYQFDKAYEFHNLRVTREKGKLLPSMSNIYFAAAIVENEIKDLFGIPFFNLALDFEGRFLLSEGAPRAPFAKSPTETGAGQIRKLPIGVDIRVQAQQVETSKTEELQAAPKLAEPPQAEAPVPVAVTAEATPEERQQDVILSEAEGGAKPKEAQDDPGE